MTTSKDQHLSIRIDKALHEKLRFVAKQEVRSVNSHVLVLIRESIRAFEREHGVIDGRIHPEANVKPSRKT